MRAGRNSAFSQNFVKDVPLATNVASAELLVEGLLGEE